MPSDGPDPTLERQQTDDSLRDEREKSDRAMAAAREAVIEGADEVLKHARETADAVLLEARERADQRLDESDAPVLASIAAGSERFAEDAVLRQERAVADEVLELERVETARVVAKLLPIERDQTDRFLLTERVRSDDALAHRDDFLGRVSHDLRDLLGGIVLSAAYLEKHADDPDAGSRTRVETARIERHAARMNRLIGDLVDVASIDAGKLAVLLVRGDLTVLIDEAADAFRAAAGVKHMQLELQCGERPLMAAFDHARLFQVLANVITNAIKFSPAGGRIVVRCEHLADSVGCSIHDRGPGIPADRLEAVFDRFSQGALSGGHGLGLGLYISRCIVEAHGGRIWAESTPGAGSSIHFTLPRAAA
jgi:signal transduction histidine kinase